MILYYILIGVGVVLVTVSVYNFFTAAKVKKSIDNYLFLGTSSHAYFLGTTLFSLALLAIIAYQVSSYVFDIRVFSIVFFFSALFLFSLSGYVYFLSVKRKHKDYKEFFEKFGIDTNNKCEKLMLKHIYSKEKDLKKVKEIFERNRHLCKKD